MTTDLLSTLGVVREMVDPESLKFMIEARRMDNVQKEMEERV